MPLKIDIEKVYKDYTSKLDPDKYNEGLGRAHCELWTSKEKLGVLEWHYLNKLTTTIKDVEFIFSPDSITNSFRNSNRLIKSLGIKEKDLIANFGNDVDKLISEYLKIDYTIGSSIIFPISIGGNTIKWTMNQARGLSCRVHDRIDFTLECIKRFYEGNKDNPLQKALEKSAPFFILFNSFDEYAHFFFLEDLIDEKGNVISFTSTIDFTSPFPTTKEQYFQYLSNTIEFIKNRNAKILDWCNQVD